MTDQELIRWLRVEATENWYLRSKLNLIAERLEALTQTQERDPLRSRREQWVALCHVAQQVGALERRFRSIADPQSDMERYITPSS